MTNVSVKVKRKPSLIEGKQMPLFIQVICNWELKRVVLDLELSQDEWRSETEEVIIPQAADNRRIAELLQIRLDLKRHGPIPLGTQMATTLSN